MPLKATEEILDRNSRRRKLSMELPILLVHNRADLKSAGTTAVQLLYKRSPECSKTPQNTLLQSIPHNNIRKTGSIRNRQVSGSSPLVGSSLSTALAAPLTEP